MSTLHEELRDVLRSLESKLEDLSGRVEAVGSNAAGRSAVLIPFPSPYPPPTSDPGANPLRPSQHAAAVRGNHSAKHSGLPAAMLRVRAV